MQSISAEEFTQRLTNDEQSIIIDTRPPNERQALPLPKALAHHPHQISLTLEQVQAGDLPVFMPDHTLYLICERGQVSELVGMYIELSGHPHMYNLKGGLQEWRAKVLS